MPANKPGKENTEEGEHYEKNTPIPISSSEGSSIFGCMRRLTKIKGDIIKPTGEKWDGFD